MSSKQFHSIRQRPSQSVLLPSLLLLLQLLITVSSTLADRATLKQQSAEHSNDSQHGGRDRVATGERGGVGQSRVSDGDPGDHDANKDSSIRDNYATLAAHFTADHFYKTLRSEVNQLLGVPVMQSVIDGLTFTQVPLNASVLRDIANRLDAAFAKYITLLRETRKYVISSMQPDLAALRDYQNMLQCSRINPERLSYEEQFGTRVNLSAACLVSQKKTNRLSYYPDNNLTSVLHANALDSAIRWQYVIGLTGPHIEYPANIIPVHKRRHCSQFIATALPFRRRIAILLDAGTLLNDAQVVKLKGIARIILDCATPNDRYTVMVATSAGVNQMCTTNNFLGTNRDQVAKMIAFIDAIEKGDHRNYSHAEAIRAAFTLFAKEEAESHEHSSSQAYENILFYVSRGVISELSETTSVLAAIAEIVLKTSICVKINTIAISDGEKSPLLWSAEFLKNIAEQNFTKYRQSFTEKIKESSNALPNVKGKMISISTNEYFVLDLLQMYELLHNNATNTATDQLHWSYPFVEQHATLISISTAVRHGNKLAAVIGIDLNMDVIADVIKYNDLVLMMTKKSRLRVLLCDLKGRVMIDSRMRKPLLWPLHIGVLEAWPTEDMWLSEHFAVTDINEGSFEIIKSKNNESIKLNYIWIRLKNAPFVIVLALEMSKPNAKVSLLVKNSRQEYALDNLVYHRLDIQRDSALPYCSHFGYLSTLNYGGVYLSPSCFTISSIQRPPSPQWIANYWVYLGDPFGLIRNTGIRIGVREHVGALSGIIPYWRDQASDGIDEYVLRRYIATPRGVMITFPATVVRDNYEPDTEPWYTRAINLLGRIVVTGPFIEDQVGQIITLSTAVFEGHAGMHNPNEDQVFAVIAMDVSVGFISRLLRNIVHICRDSRRCVLFDDMGTVVVRGSVESGMLPKHLNSSSSSRRRSWNGEAVERHHLSYLEPELVTQLITSTGFVRKQRCVHWSTRSIERLFHFNISYEDVITVPCEESISSSSNSRLGNVRAEVIPIPQTNLFLALINESCAPAHPIHAFCPCSVSDRRCLLCSRFDAIECECPCQCSIDNNLFCSRDTNATISQKNRTKIGQKSNEDEKERELQKTGSFVEEDQRLEECPISVTPVLFNAKPTQKIALSECKEVGCDRYKSIDSCLGIIGCQWCSIANDGKTPLDNPFCSPIDLCSGGIKGRRIKSFLSAESQMTPQWSVGAPVGPVAAGIMSVFLMMVVAVYCYRSQVSRLVEANSLTDSYGAPLCGRTIEEDDFQFDHDGLNGLDAVKNVTPIQLASFEKTSNPPTVVRAQYRASPRTESSDYGYSTMTDRAPGDESEGASSSINISRQTGKTLLTTIYSNEDNCSSIVTTEADVHQMPRALLIS